jgi:hypothetical protein
MKADPTGFISLKFQLVPEGGEEIKVSEAGADNTKVTRI